MNFPNHYDFRDTRFPFREDRNYTFRNNNYPRYNNPLKHSFNPFTTNFNNHPYYRPTFGYLQTHYTRPDLIQSNYLRVNTGQYYRNNNFYQHYPNYQRRFASDFQPDLSFQDKRENFFKECHPLEQINSPHNYYQFNPKGRNKMNLSEPKLSNRVIMNDIPEKINKNFPTENKINERSKSVCKNNNSPSNPKSRTPNPKVTIQNKEPKTYESIDEESVPFQNRYHYALGNRYNNYNNVFKAYHPFKKHYYPNNWRNGIRFSNQPFMRKKDFIKGQRYFQFSEGLNNQFNKRKKIYDLDKEEETNWDDNSSMEFAGKNSSPQENTKRNLQNFKNLEKANTNKIVNKSISKTGNIMQSKDDSWKNQNLEDVTKKIEESSSIKKNIISSSLEKEEKDKLEKFDEKIQTIRGIYKNIDHEDLLSEGKNPEELQQEDNTLRDRDGWTE